MLSEAFKEKSNILETFIVSFLRSIRHPAAEAASKCGTEATKKPYSLDSELTGR